MVEAPTRSLLRRPLTFRPQLVFLFTVGVLASTILLKVGAIQYLELVYFGLILVLLLLFAEHRYHLVCFRINLGLAIAYLVFSLAAVGLGIASLRFQFYLPLYLPPIKGPLLITLARVAELVSSLAGMFYMAEIFGRNAALARFTMKVYFNTGVASGLYSLLSVPAGYVGIPFLGTYGPMHRMRGFYNEGGPYGLYVLSVLFVGLALDRRGWTGRRLHRFWMAMMAVVFVLCYSKAAVFATLLTFAINAFMARGRKTRIVTLGAGLLFLAGSSFFINVPGIVRGYQATAAAYERLSHFHAKDYSFVYGRVAGAFIVPRMIAAHPLTGVGWGNYGLLRNAPEYRGAAVFTEDADDPGLGLFGLAAELGLPLTAFLLILFATPYIYLRSLKAPSWLTNLALLQPVVHLFGAQLNVTYPWVVTAFALGLGIHLNATRKGLAEADGFPASYKE